MSVLRNKQDYIALSSGHQPSAPPGMADNWNTYRVLIALTMVVTGSVNTLAAKWADKLTALGLKFQHPFLQAVCMFIGEFLCLPVFFIVFYFSRRRHRKLQNESTSVDASQSTAEVDAVEYSQQLQPHLHTSRSSLQVPLEIPRFNPLILLPASLCDMCATSISYVGLNLTSAASFQMLRGSVILFTGIFSILILRVRLAPFKWIGMLFVIIGLVVVGLSDVLRPGEDTPADVKSIIAGDLLIVASQVIVAVQMVYEQKYVIKYNIPPLLAVGLEGLFGFLMLALLMIPFYFIKVPAMFSNDPEHRLDNALLAFRQIGANYLIAIALIGTVVSIAFFNFSGVTITVELAATTRMVLDSVRTLVIWLFSLAVVWQHFSYIQLIGFVVLLGGMFVYNDVFLGPTHLQRYCPERTGCLWRRLQGTAQPSSSGGDDDVEPILGHHATDTRTVVS